MRAADLSGALARNIRCSTASEVAEHQVGHHRRCIYNRRMQSVSPLMIACRSALAPNHPIRIAGDLLYR
jgi:hypothetical protein